MHNRYIEEMAYHYGCCTHDPRLERILAPDEYIFDDMDGDEAEEIIEDELVEDEA